MTEFQGTKLNPAAAMSPARRAALKAEEPELLSAMGLAKAQWASSAAPPGGLLLRNFLFKETDGGRAPPEEMRRIIMDHSLMKGLMPRLLPRYHRNKVDHYRCLKVPPGWTLKTQ